MKPTLSHVIVLLVFGAGTFRAPAQSQPSPARVTRDLAETRTPEQRLEALSAAIEETQQRLADYQAELLRLHEELQTLRTQQAPAPATSGGAADAPSSTSAAPVALAESVEERQQALEAAVKTHEQDKVESGSKYPVRLTGLVLFNAFLNRGLADNIDLPNVALHQTATSGGGGLAASLRQTVIGIEGDGPRLLGAHTSASVDFDFFSGLSYSSYNTAAGSVRMRTASINFDWPADSLSAGMSSPLISPLSPTSYATVAEPALAGAGNLWTWAPQLRYGHRFAMHRGDQLQLELGLRDSAAAGYSSNQFVRAASPAEASNQPAYQTRVSYGRSGEQGLQVGMGGYYSRQVYPDYTGAYRSERLDSWAATFDARVPAGRFEFSGEGYRGRSLGGLGGGVSKDVIVGSSPATGTYALQGLNAIGGWVQWKSRLASTLETNVSMGLDNGMARDFHALVLSPSASATQLRARNRMLIANAIFRPKTYLILSPEYRRIWTWPIAGSANTLDVYTLTFGYQF